MNKIIIASTVLLFSLCSCSNNDNLVQYRALNESLKNSAMLATRENDKIYDEMEIKLKALETQAKAEIWQPKAIEVKKLSSAIKEFIDTLKRDLIKSAVTTASNGNGAYNEADKKSVELLFEEQAGLQNYTKNSLVLKDP